MTTLKSTVPTHDILAQLRTVAHGAIGNIEELRRIARRQAKLLSALLAIPLH